MAVERPARAGFRHGCRLRILGQAPSAHCPANRPGIPRTKKCPGCGGEWSVDVGYWGVFVHRGDGRYPEADALHLTTLVATAERWMAKNDPEGRMVVRFVTIGEKSNG